MRLTAALLFLLFYIPASSQNFVLKGGEYMDTVMTRNPACAKAPVAPYFSVDAKYPRSSETLAAEANSFLQRSNQHHKVTGYVTFRFVVDCAGFRQPMTQVLQTDAAYQKTHFSKELINELYAFVQSLKNWRTVTAPNGMQVNYFTYLTFKISNGKVVAVIP